MTFDALAPGAQGGVMGVLGHAGFLGAVILVRAVAGEAEGIGGRVFDGHRGLRAIVHVMTVRALNAVIMHHAL